MYRIIILNCLFVLASNLLVAQSGDGSPYSRIGIGEQNNANSIIGLSMGSTGICLSDSNTLNTLNPASYAFIGRNRPIFGVNLGGRFASYSSSNSGSSSSQNIGLRSIGFGFPVGKNMGLSFGISPLSSVGYDINYQEALAGSTSDSVTYYYQGNGGLNRVHLGTAITLLGRNSLTKRLKNPERKLSLGVNAAYNFGTINRIRQLNFNSNSYLDAYTERTISLSALNFETGLLYKDVFKLKDTIRINDTLITITRNSPWSYSIGATYRLGSSLNAESSLLSYSTSFGSGFLLDTVEYISAQNGTITLPTTIGIGFNLEYSSPNNDTLRNPLKKARRFVFEINYKTTDWSSYSESFGGVTSTDQLANSSLFAVGFMYQPNDLRRRGSKTKFYEYTQYRLGFNYQNTYLNLQNTQLTNYGMSFGLGIPLANAGMKNASMINFGLELGSKGTFDNNLIKENYLGCYLGLTLTPGVYNRWFVKRKYD